MSEYTQYPFKKMTLVAIILLAMAFTTSIALLLITVLEPLRAKLVPEFILPLQIFIVFHFLFVSVFDLYLLRKSKDTYVFNARGIAYKTKKGIVWEKSWDNLRYAYRHYGSKGGEFLVLSPTSLKVDEIEDSILKAKNCSTDDKIVLVTDAEAFQAALKIMEAYAEVTVTDNITT